MNKKSRAQLDSKPKMYFDLFLLVTFFGDCTMGFITILSPLYCTRQKWCLEFLFSGIASNKQILKTKWDPWGKICTLQSSKSLHLSPVFLFPGWLQWVGDVGRKGSPRSFFQAHSYWIWAHEWYVRTRFCVPLKSNVLKPPEVLPSRNGHKKRGDKKIIRRGNGDPKRNPAKKNRV